MSHFLSKLRKFFIRSLAGFFCLLLIIVGIDFLAAVCPKKSHIAAAIDQVDEARLKSHVETLSAIGSRFQIIKKNSGLKAGGKYPPHLRKINQKLAPLGKAMPTGAEKEKKIQYLTKELHKIGLEPASLDFDFKSYGVGTNIYATRQGSSGSEDLLDVIAHYDTYAGSPGADDNNSGVAGVLEIARLVMAQKSIDRSVRFVFYDYEEFGLWGSTSMVKTMMDEPEKLQPATACLNLEMIGYFSDEPNSQTSPIRIPILVDPPTTGNYIVTIGNRLSYRHGRRLDGVFKTYVPQMPVFSGARIGDFVADAARSDHLPYWENGIPAVVLGDTANFRNPHYHKPSDVPETLDFSRMRLVVKGAAAFVLDWCGSEG